MDENADQLIDENTADIIATTPTRRVSGPHDRVKRYFIPVVTEKILDAIRSGATQALAAQYAGISPKTLAQWLKEGEEAEEGDPLNTFWLKYQQSRGVKAKVTLERIQEIAESINSWQGLAWVLERSFPRDFGKGVFGGDPSEVPEIKHIIEIVREGGDTAPELPEGAGTTRYQLSGPEDHEPPADENDGDITDYPRISPVD